MYEYKGLPGVDKYGKYGNKMKTYFQTILSVLLCMYYTTVTFLDMISSLFLINWDKIFVASQKNYIELSCFELNAVS